MGDWGLAGYIHRRINFPFRDDFGGFTMLLFRASVYDGTSTCFMLPLCGYIGFLAFDDIFVTDEVGEDKAIESMGSARVKGSLKPSTGGVNGYELFQAQVCCDYYVERREEFRRLSQHILCVDVECDSWVELSDLRRRSLRSLALVLA